MDPLHRHEQANRRKNERRQKRAHSERAELYRGFPAPDVEPRPHVARQRQNACNRRSKADDVPDDVGVLLPSDDRKWDATERDEKAGPIDWLLVGRCCTTPSSCVDWLIVRSAYRSLLFRPAYHHGVIDGTAQSSRLTDLSLLLRIHHDEGSVMSVPVAECAWRGGMERSARYRQQATRTGAADLYLEPATGVGDCRTVR